MSPLFAFIFALLSEDDVKAIVAITGLLSLLATLWKGNQKIQEIDRTVKKTHFNGNKSLADGGSMAEALTRIEANSEQGRNETRALRGTTVDLHSRLGRIEKNFDDGMNRLDGRIDKLDTKMDKHIERTNRALGTERP